MKEKINGIAFITFIIGVAASVMIFLPAIRYENIDTVYSGFQVTFGVEIVDIGIATGQLEFNFLALLAYGLPVIAGILLMFSKKAALISMLLFVAAAILLFTLPLYVYATATGFGGTTDIEIDWVMQYGLMIAGSLSILGVFSSALQTFNNFRD